MAEKQTKSITWREYNQYALFNALADIEQIILRYLNASSKTKKSASLKSVDLQIDEDISPSALENLYQSLNLNPFERKALLLCIAVELLKDFPLICAEIHHNPQMSYPTLGLLLTVFSDEAYWEILAPQSSLRYWKLIEIEAGPSLTTQRLRISEYALYYLMGNPNMDTRLTPLLKPLMQLQHVTSTQQVIVEDIWKLLMQAEQIRPSPCLHITAKNIEEGCALLAYASQQRGFLVYHLNTNLLPNNLQDLELLCCLLQREALLNQCIYLIEYDAAIIEKSMQRFMLSTLIERLPTYCILISQIQPSWLNYPINNLEIPPSEQEEQLQIWQTTLKEFARQDAAWLKKLSTQFKLTTSQIQSIAAIANLQTALSQEEVQKYIWQQCRQQLRQELSGLIQVIEPKASWHDLVLPELQTNLLHDISLHVAYRYEVYQNWGFAEKSSRGLGICALFAGPSGTGKTLAAEVLAHELGLDLYHIDLSMLVSKYIGETEKNINKIFAAAEASGALLLFDEADALFGKRSEVKDSHDRYANIEVSYLLQRIEAYQGLSILTTNLKNAIDDAFLRRIRFIVQFPFPDAAQRKLIWQRVFPAQTPTKDLDFDKLARLNLTGGHIRSIALNAAFLAAGQIEAVSMQHILNATHREHLKLEKTLPAADIKDWIT